MCTEKLGNLEKDDPDFAAMDPIRTCVLVTDGAPMDCGGTKAMQLPEAQEFVRPEVTFDMCMPKNGEKFLSLYLGVDGALGPNVDPRSQFHLNHLAKFAGCTGYTDAGFETKVGTVNGGKCDGFLATTQYERSRSTPSG